MVTDIRVSDYRLRRRGWSLITVFTLLQQLVRTSLFTKSALRPVVFSAGLSVVVLVNNEDRLIVLLQVVNWRLPYSCTHLVRLVR